MAAGSEWNRIPQLLRSSVPDELRKPIDCKPKTAVDKVFARLRPSCRTRSGGRDVTAARSLRP
jgi:hypothetical protein